MADQSMALVPAGYLPTEQEAAHTYKLSTNAAHLCGEIVKATAMKIQGRRYVRSEGWLAIAVAHGCVVSVREVENVEGGIRAVAELRRMSDQALIATAEGFVGDDETMWAKRPLFARRAMAQTRASSRVCRTVFAHVAIMVDAGLATTPAEEMMGVYPGDHDGDPRGDVDGPGSSWGAGGKEAAVDDARRDGLMDNAPKVSPAKRAEMEKWTENAIGTLRLSGQTTDSLRGLWAEWNNAKPPAKWARLALLEEYAPDLYDKVTTTYDAAQEQARAVAA